MTSHRTWLDIVAADPAHSRRYAHRWRNFAREGRDIVGEARLIDAMVPRGSSILDAGCGQGRIGGYLAAAGHRVVGVDIDPYLIGEARREFPGATWRVGDLKDLGTTLDDAGSDSPQHFDAIVVAGNVLTFVDPADRAVVLSAVRSALTDDGRVVCGFGAGRGFDFDEFFALADEAGLKEDGRFSTWDLRPFNESSTFLVAVLSRL